MIKTTSNNFLLTLIILLAFSTNIFSQEKVVIKGKQIINIDKNVDENNNIMDAVELAMWGIPVLSAISEALLSIRSSGKVKKIENFTITFVENKLRMDITQTKETTMNDTDAGLIDTYTVVEKNSGTIIFRFNSMGTTLTMSVKMSGAPAITMVVPPKNEITLSKLMSGILTSSSTNGSEIIGYQTSKYTYHDKAKLKETKMGKKFMQQVIHTDVWVSPDVDGISIISDFYEKMITGGYDIGGGSEGGSVMSSIGMLLEEIGMPLKSRESVIFYPITVNKNGTELVSDKFILKTTVQMDISSYEVSDDAPDASVFNDLEDDEGEETNTDEPNTEKEDPAACDCSCAKYKELMAMSKMSKKDVKNSKMPQLNMNCITGCATEWANCIKQ
jgi:hypothetical protein